MRVELIIGLLFCLFGAYAKHSWSQRTRAAMFVTGSMLLVIGAVRQYENGRLPSSYLA